MNNTSSDTVAFFDIDGTLANLEPVHGQTIHTLFPDADLDDITQTFIDGFRLGTFRREMDRIIGIYRDGKDTWRDQKYYLTERTENGIILPDQKDHPSSIEAIEYITRFDAAATSVLDTIQKENPSFFEDAKIQPVVALAEKLYREGIPLFIMTANTRNFAHAALQYLGIHHLFIDIGTEEDMIGGGKEIIMETFLQQRESQGHTGPKKIIIVGDSLRGDIGSGYRLNQMGHAYNIEGILVTNNKEKTQQVIVQDANLSEIIEHTDTQILAV